MTGTCVVLVIAITLFLQYFYRFYLLDLPSDKLYQERDPNSFHRPTSVGATLRVTAVDDGLVIARNDCRAFYQQFQATGTRVWPVDEDVDDRIVNQIRLEDVGVSQQLKTILVFDGLGEDTDGGQGRFISDRCPVNRCTLTDQLDRVDAADVVIFKVSYVITIKNIIVTSSLAHCTSSSAVAKRPRDASCLSVVSFNIPIQRSFFIISYYGFRFTSAQISIKFCFAVSYCLRRCPTKTPGQTSLGHNPLFAAVCGSVGVRTPPCGSDRVSSTG